jgi:hypothetical protein
MYKSPFYAHVVGITAILCLLCGNVFGQDYVAYQKIINRIDEDIITNDLQSATAKFDTIYKQYSFVFATHCIKALQICCANTDSINADKWLAKCFVQGVPLWVIRTNELTNKAIGYSTTQHTLKKYDSLRVVYKAAVNWEVARQIDSLIAIDQRHTKMVNDGFILWRYILYYPLWLRNNKRQFAIIDSIIDKYGFPGERLIGLPEHYNDSALHYSDFVFYGPFLADTRTRTMLLHYYSTAHKDINNKLKANVANGFLPAYQYGAINDFLAEYGKKRYGYKYYNVWHTDINKDNIPHINERRALIGLSTYETQLKHSLIWRERRKNKIANSSIVLE